MLPIANLNCPSLREAALLNGDCVDPYNERKGGRVAYRSLFFPLFWFTTHTHNEEPVLNVEGN